MYTSIRRYEGVTDTDEVIRRAADEFAPMLADRPGFIGYYLVNAGDGVIASISVFETEAAARESTEAAAGWARERLGELAPNPPQVTAGATTTGAQAEAGATA